MGLIVLFFAFPFVVFIMMNYFNIFFKFSDWLGFLGGYCGALGAFIAANIQLKEQRKLFDKQQKEEKRKIQLGSLKALKYQFENLNYYLQVETPRDYFITLLSILEKCVVIPKNYILLEEKNIKELNNNLINLGTFKHSIEILKIIDTIEYIERTFKKSLTIYNTNISEHFSLYLNDLSRHIDINKKDEFNIFKNNFGKNDINKTELENMITQIGEFISIYKSSNNTIQSKANFNKCFTFVSDWLKDIKNIIFEDSDIPNIYTLIKLSKELDNILEKLETEIKNLS